MSTQRTKSDFTVFETQPRVREVYSHGHRRSARHLSRDERAEVVARVASGEDVCDVAASLNVTESGAIALVEGRKERVRARVYRAPILRQLPEDNATAPRVRCDRFECELS